MDFNLLWSVEKKEIESPAICATSIHPIAHPRFINPSLYY